MSAPAQLNQIVALLAKEEAVYSVAETLSNTLDGCDVYIGDGDPAPPDAYNVVYDGANGRASGTLAPQRMLEPNGLFREGSLQQRVKGLGSLYSAILTPPNELHRFFKAGGLDATYSATPTPQWTYTPTPAGSAYTSLTMQDFRQGALYPSRGVLTDWTIEGAGLGAALVTFTYKGINDNATDVATPATTILGATTLPPVNAAVVFALGDYTTPVVQSWKITANRSIDTARVAQNVAGGHLGFVPGGMMIEAEFVLERPLRSVYNPEALHRSRASEAVSIALGTTQYNSVTFTLPQAQIAAVPEPGAEGNLATVTVRYAAHASTPTANDFFSMLFN